MTRARWFPILALVFMATMINYLNRTVFGIAKPLLVHDLRIDPVWAGLLGSAFQWSYAAAQLPAGALLDRLGTRITYTLSLIGWSLFTLIQGSVSTMGAMIGARVGLGLFEAPCFPANSRVLAHWFPQQERARANSIYSIGMFAGIAFLSVPLFWLTQTYGWRALFLLTGAIGIVFGILWYLVYREPHDSKLADQAELDYITAGGGLKTDQADSAPLVLCQPASFVAADGLCLGGSIRHQCRADFLPNRFRQLSHRPAAYDLPQCRVRRGAALHSRGGRRRRRWPESDRLLKNGKGANLARKLPIVTGLLLAACLPIVNYIPANQNGLT